MLLEALNSISTPHLFNTLRNLKQVSTPLLLTPINTPEKVLVCVLLGLVKNLTVRMDPGLAKGAFRFRFARAKRASRLVSVESDWEAVSVRCLLMRCMSVLEDSLLAEVGELEGFDAITCRFAE